ncbi:hypothetical protein GE21DRAFT_1309363 [Neurospora crassa]|uniref:Uncharacterized protein B24H17.180 n=1 Tax=Neurospora crassa TaxID=5141 RepID=Q9P527_NEUCS|nr:hypothetical protein GE21DRAFT_1309363 [Neurospora crassa]CAB92640.2 hypothetical protein [Neurospora crassa]
MVLTQAVFVASGSDRGRKGWKEVKKTTGRTRIERRTGSEGGGQPGVDWGWADGPEGAEGLATNGCGWVRVHYGPKVPRNQSDGYELCEEGKPSGRRACGDRLGTARCFHFYWSLARKLGEPLWNGRPRIVPSLWGDHSTAARTVALSPSNSYRLGDVGVWAFWRRAGSELPSGRPVVTPRRGSGNELKALRQQTDGQTKRFRGGEECLGPRQGSQALKRARDFRVGSLRNERGRKM